MRKRSSLNLNEGPVLLRKRVNSPDSIASTDTGFSEGSAVTTISSKSSGSSSSSSSSGSSASSASATSSGSGSSSSSGVSSGSSSSSGSSGSSASNGSSGSSSSSSSGVSSGSSSSSSSGSSGSSSTSTKSSSSSSSGVSSVPSDEVMEVDNPLDEAVISDDEEGGTRIGDIYIPPPVKPYCSTECKGPRLIIKKIENYNFKSYAGKVVLGPFHQRFTAIIGPNGSGKSNVIDSMLFVFGYRANKIRSKKISSLLHSSAKYPNCTSCSVAVHFCEIVDKDDGDCDEVPNSEIIIQRTAFRDNTSYYTINGKRAVFKDVAKLLKSHNVDLDHNRFLILQGEVESIAMMKPKGPSENEVGMLEYLEDIVGTTRYKVPLEKISDRVDQLTEERTEKLNRCKLAEREMNDLEKPYNEAVDYLKMENEYTRTKSCRIQKYISEKSKKAQEYENHHSKISNDLKEHDEKAEAMKKEREEKEKLIRKEIEQFEELKKTREELQRKFEKATSKFTEIQQTMTVINKRRKESKVQLEKYQQELEELKKVPEKNQKEIEECEKKLERLNKQHAELDAELQRNYKVVEEESKPLIEKRDKVENELMDYKQDVDAAKSGLAELETEMRILKHDETSEKRKYESLKTSYENSQADLKKNKEKYEELRVLLPQMAEEIVKSTAKLEQLVKEEEETSEILTRLKIDLEQKAELLRTSTSNNKVLDFLMTKKAEGVLPGIYGRLGDLGAIDNKFDVAVSTACGRLDNIIVDTVSTAQNCIEALKNHNVGRASFIALEKVAYLADHSYRIETPENAPRLYDLIRVEDERVLPAFYFALRNTLVAIDMEQARRIAYGQQRYRVVTLGGGVIETSGTMSGGGKQLIRGKMGARVQTQTVDASLPTKKEIEDMQIKVEELQSKVNYNQEEQTRLERDIHTLKVQKQKNDVEIKKVDITIKSLEEQISRVIVQVEAQKTRMEQTITDATKVKALEDQITEKKSQLAVSEEAANKIIKKINAIKAQLEALHTENVKSVQSKMSNVNNQMKKLTTNITKLRVEISSSERNVMKMNNQIEGLQSGILKAQEDLTEMGAERKMYDEQIVEFNKLKTEADEAIEKAKTDSSGIQKEIQALQKQENESKLKRVEIEQKLQNITQKLSEVKSHIPKLHAALKPLKLNKIPGEEETEQPFKQYTDEELDGHSLTDLQYKESVLEEKLKTKPNLSIIEEYTNKRNIYLARVKVLEDVSSRRNEMRQLYDDVRKKRFDEFMAGYQIITRKLKEMYQMITQGGDADLELVDTLDPFTEGVSFSVRPPKKSWKNISNLSGGEKTLSSLALVFALHYYKPSPLYFMDEIDAALDFKNVSIVAHYIKERTRNAQFIIISLRTNMFELGDRLVGIYKVKDCTNSITIKNFQMPAFLPPASQMLSMRPRPNPDFSFTINKSFTSLHGSYHEDPIYHVPQAKQMKLIDPRIIIDGEPEAENGKENTANNNAEPIASTSAEALCRLTQAPIFASQGRDTTFAPNSDFQSTAQSFLLQQNATLRNSESNASANTSINDGIFKKPLPPPPRIVNV